MTEPKYPVARAAALRLEQQCAHLAPAGTPLPSVEEWEALLQVAFWASLRREEGHWPKVSLALLAPERATRPLLFAMPVALTPESLTRIAPAVDRPGVHLGTGGMYLWGTTHHLPPYCPVVEVIAPGLLVVKSSRAEAAGKFVNLAVLEGDQLKMIDHGTAALPDCPAMLTPLLDLESQFRVEDSAGTLIQLAVSMRAHGRGGTLLIVSGEAWRDSILTPMPYAVSPPFATTAARISRVAGLTAADGATILNERFELLAFGAKIVRRRGAAQVAQITLSEPIEGAIPTVVEPAQLGGTRHISAAQFTHDQREALAMVASQDGRFTLFGWSACDDRVHARRVESLLL
ncbi:MAG: hypothetical protein K2X03_09235 [Bryobacteraceae bacterium]|nr:hypothetical protein [Bryobacteraceae bacterium]